MSVRGSLVVFAATFFAFLLLDRAFPDLAGWPSLAAAAAIGAAVGLLATRIDRGKA